MRKLVTVREVTGIVPIDGADAIELAIIDGWQCVVKKGEFKVGEQAVYFEIDSFLPIEDKRFGFIMPRGTVRFEGGLGHKLRSIKLRGQLSQGLLLPLKDFPEIGPAPFIAGHDWSEVLNVKKWEAPIPAQLAGQVRGSFPSFIPKTDEERIQNFRDPLKTFADLTFEVSLKLNGSSMTVYYFAEEEPAYGVCSRNLNLKITDENQDNTLISVAKRYDLERKLKETGRNLALQGELIGDGIQKNFEQISGQDFYVFRIWDIDAKRFVSPVERRELCDRLGLKHTVVYEEALKLSQFSSVAEILKYAEGPSMNVAVREGLVFKSNEKLSGPWGEGDFVTFKAISNAYLLKGGE